MANVRKPLGVGFGRRIIRTSATGSAAVLGRQMQADFNGLVDDISHYFKQVEDGLPEDMKGALEPTKALAEHYTPKKTHALVDSSYLEEVSYRGATRVELGFAKDGPDYAVYVHEMPYQHESPTSAKFLSRALDEDYYNILQRVADNVKIRMGI